jgi:HK97 family phage portal protein
MGAAFRRRGVCHTRVAHPSGYGLKKSLAAALVSGARRPLAIKASLQSWLGVPIKLTDGDFWREYGGAASFLGKRVSVDEALQLSTVWACVRLISETLATLPLGFYRRNTDGSRTSATSHQLYEVLHSQPNADMTAVVFWEVVVASLLLWGNAYIEIIRSANKVIALQFLIPARMNVRKLAGGGYEYRYRDTTGSGAERPISEESLMHIPAFSTDGVFGLSPIAYGANVFGTAMQTDQASAETFRDSMRSPGLVTMDMLLKKQQREDIRAHVKDVSERGGVMVLEKGASFQKLGFDPVSAELLSSRSFNVEEICRWYGIDPAMVGHGGKDSNWGTGLEQKMLWFLVFALRKWCVRIEQAIRKSLLSPVERLTLFAEFNMEGLLRGDSTTRAAFYASAGQNGWKTRNEIRRLENDPPMAGGDVLTVQSNLVPLDQLGKAPTADRTAADAVLAWLGIQPSAGVPAKE